MSELDEPSPSPAEAGPSNEACLGALERVWTGTGPKFSFEPITLEEPLNRGDLIVTVVYHTIESLDEIVASSQVRLCVSFLIAIVASAQVDKLEKKLAFELFGDGGQGEHYVWRFLQSSDEINLTTVGTGIFRHRYSEAKYQAYDRDDCIERCKYILNPFPDELMAQGNADILANWCLSGLVPVDVLLRFRKRLPSLELVNGTLTAEQMSQDGRLKLSIARSLAKHTVTRAHALARVGHIGILVETSFVLGGAAYDLAYDRQNLLSNLKYRGKLGAASAAGGAVGAAIGLAVPIPGFFFVTSVAGSVTGRWIASQFVPEGANLSSSRNSSAVASEMADNEPSSCSSASLDVEMELLELDELELELMEFEKNFLAETTTTCDDLIKF